MADSRKMPNFASLEVQKQHILLANKEKNRERKLWDRWDPHSHEMFRLIGSSSIGGNQVSLYRLNRTGLTVYTIHSDSTIVNSYFVIICFCG